MNGAELQKLLSDNMKKYRKAKSLTQFELAEKIDLSEESIKRIETLKQWPGEKTLAAIAEALDVDVYKLFLPPAAELEIGNKDFQKQKEDLTQKITEYNDSAVLDLIG